MLSQNHIDTGEGSGDGTRSGAGSGERQGEGDFQQFSARCGEFDRFGGLKTFFEI